MADKNIGFNAGLSEIASFWQSAFFSAINESLSFLPHRTAVENNQAQPVLIIPGLGMGDYSMALMRSKLEAMGYQVQGWGSGINQGYSIADENRLKGEVERLYKKSGKQVALIGWSLGGFYARAIANDCSQFVSQVITLGTPYLNIEDNVFSNAYRSLTGNVSGLNVSEQVMKSIKRSQQPLSVPYTSIYSCNDIISGEASCHGLDQPNVKSVQVQCNHFDMGSSSRVFDAIIVELQAQKNQKDGV